MNKQQMQQWVLRNCKFAQAEFSNVVREIGETVLPAIQQLKGKGQIAPTDIKMTIRQKLFPFLKSRPDLQAESAKLESLIQQYVAQKTQAQPARPAPQAKPMALPGKPQALPRKPFA